MKPILAFVLLTTAACGRPDAAGSALTDSGDHPLIASHVRLEMTESLTVPAVAAVAVTGSSGDREATFVGGHPYDQIGHGLSRPPRSDATTCVLGFAIGPERGAFAFDEAAYPALEVGPMELDAVVRSVLFDGSNGPAGVGPAHMAVVDLRATFGSIEPLTKRGIPVKVVGRDLEASVVRLSCEGTHVTWASVAAALGPEVQVQELP